MALVIAKKRLSTHNKQVPVPNNLGQPVIWNLAEYTSEIFSTTKSTNHDK